MPKFKVWYMRPEWFRVGIMGTLAPPGQHASDLVDVDHLDKTHIELTGLNVKHPLAKEWIEAKSLDDLYSYMQGEIWSPRGEARNLILGKGLAHTSMSVGDVCKDETGKVFMVDTVGWIELKQKGTKT
jgi:hypothetical protein